MLIIHDKRIPEEYIIALKDKVPSARFLPFGGISSKNEVYASIRCHPDIYFFQLNKNTLVHAPGVDKKLLDTLRDSGITLVPGEKDPEGKYPDTVRYNAVRVGNKVFLNENYSDSAVLDAVANEGLDKINISQGYARCGILPVGNNMIVTADEGAHKAAVRSAIRSLLISPGGILLPGEKYGFIGGCGGFSFDHKLFILGDLSAYSQGGLISDFALSQNDGIVTLRGLQLFDAGCLIVI